MLEPKNAFEALLPTSILKWITGSGIFEYPHGSPPCVLSIIYSMTVFSYCTYFKWNYEFCKGLVNSFDIIILCVKAYCDWFAVVFSIINALVPSHV